MWGRVGPARARVESTARHAVGGARAALTREGYALARGQQKSNKEKRKPKQDKAKPASQTATFGSGVNFGGKKR
jgi:hypothetical protein